jgi:hypothetical protein
MITKERSKVAKSVRNEQNSLKQEPHTYGQLKVRKSKQSDVDYLKYHLKRADLLEIWRSHGYSPEKALTEGFERSDSCYTILSDVPIAMFGVVSKSLLSDKGVIWMLSSYELERYTFTFLKHCGKYVESMLEDYKVLENYVDIDNKKTIKWLKFLGAKMEEPIIYGIRKMPFRRFTFEH